MPITQDLILLSVDENIASTTVVYRDADCSAGDLEAVSAAMAISMRLVEGAEGQLRLVGGDVAVIAKQEIGRGTGVSLASRVGG